MTPGGWMTLEDRDADLFDRLTPLQRQAARLIYERDGEVFIRRRPDGTPEIIGPEDVADHPIGQRHGKTRHGDELRPKPGHDIETTGGGAMKIDPGKGGSPYPGDGPLIDPGCGGATMKPEDVFTAAAEMNMAVQCQRCGRAAKFKVTSQDNLMRVLDKAGWLPRGSGWICPGCADHEKQQEPASEG